MDVTRSVASPSDDIKKAAVFEKDALLSAQTMIYDDGEMKKTLPSDVYERFKAALVDGVGHLRRSWFARRAAHRFQKLRTS